MYMDAGHAGWLRWSANIAPAATLFSQIYTSAGKPASLRGLATNVANYNAWSATTCASYTQGDANCDEKRYINALAPLLTANGFPAHFIMDTCKLIIVPYMDYIDISQLEMEFSLQSRMPGVIGVTSSALVSASDLPPTQAIHSKMLSSGLSQAESVMEPQIPHLHDTMPTVATLMHFNLLLRREPGSRRTFHNCWLMPILHFKTERIRDADGQLSQDESVGLRRSLISSTN